MPRLPKAVSNIPKARAKMPMISTGYTARNIPPASNMEEAITVKTIFSLFIGRPFRWYILIPPHWF